MSACAHPPENVTWDHKGPGRTVALIDGMLHGTCDLCGEKVIRPAHFEPEPSHSRNESEEPRG